MDKLSERVKDLMFSYPTLYPTRFQALVALFSGAGGYKWDRDGTIVPDCRDGGHGQTEMRYDDLDEREVKLAEDRKRFGDIDSMTELNDRFEREIKLERLQRQFIEANIELVATTTLRNPVATNWVSIIDDFAPEFTEFKPIYHVPENAEESFKQGAWELIDELSPGLYGKDDRGTREALLAQKKKILGITPEMEAEQVALAKQIMDEILAEEAGNAQA